MDSQNVFRHFFRAVLHEMFRSKGLYNIAASCILVSVMVLGYFWQESYVSQATISTAQRSGSVIDNSQLQRLLNVYNTHSFQEHTVKTLEQKLLPFAEIQKDKMAMFQKESSAKLLESNVIHLSYKNTSPQLAKNILDVLVVELMEKVQPKQNRSILLDQMAQLQKDEARLHEFIAELKTKRSQLKAAQNRDISSRSIDRLSSIREALQDVDVNISAVSAKIEGIKRRLSQADVVHEAAQKMESLVGQKLKVESLLEENRKVYSSSSTEVISLQQELDNLNIEIISLRDAHPKVTKKATQNTQLSDSLYQQLRQQLTLEELELESLESRRSSLKKIHTKEDKKALVNQNYEAEILRFLQQEKSAEEELVLTRNTFDKVQQKLNDRERKNKRFIVLDAPNIPESYTGLGFVEFLILGPILAFGIPFLAAALFVLTDSRIRTSRQIKKSVSADIPVLGVIPHSNSAKTLRIFHRAILGLIMWGVFVFVTYFTVGVIGLKG